MGLAGVVVVRDHRIPLAVVGGRLVGVHPMAQVVVARARLGVGGQRLVWAAGARVCLACLGVLVACLRP